MCYGIIFNEWIVMYHTVVDIGSNWVAICWKAFEIKTHVRMILLQFNFCINTKGAEIFALSSDEIYAAGCVIVVS